MTLIVQPGDVLTVHTGGLWSWVVRLGPRLRNWLYRAGEPEHWNHVLVVMPDDARGNRWAVEGKPGGVGWRDLTSSGYLDDPYTLVNNEQSKTAEQRAQICVVMETMAQRHTPYDWPAIAIDIARIVSPLWGMRDKWGKGVPGHVVCSSAADLAYESVGLASPRPDRFCTPWDWARFDQEQGWRVHGE